MASVDVCLKLGADSNQPDMHGNTPLIYVIEGKAVSEEKQISMLKLLIGYGADVNKGTFKHNQTPVFFSVLWKRHKILKFLAKEPSVDRGHCLQITDPNSRSVEYHGKNAKEFAQMLNNSEAVRILEEHWPEQE